MQMNANTIFITGGTSGIGQGLAEAFHARGNQVIISGRREDRLRDICARNSGMRYFVLDVRDPEAIRTVAGRVLAEFPALNCVFNNAGVQRRLVLAPGTPLDEQGLLDEITPTCWGSFVWPTSSSRIWPGKRTPCCSTSPPGWGSFPWRAFRLIAPPRPPFIPSPSLTPPVERFGS